MNAAVFESYALEAVSAIFESHDYALMVGGTGLYIKAFAEGMDLIPAIPAAIRESVIREYHEKGTAWLQETIRREDPDYFSRGETENPQRMMRALEVKRHTNQSILSFQLNRKKKRDFNIVKLGISLPREQLYSNINLRVDQMMNSGLLQEAQGLVSYKNLNALQTVGYAEIFQYLDGEKKLPEAVADIKKHTRHYAKRQMTWFTKDPEVHWLHHPTTEAAAAIIKNLA